MLSILAFLLPASAATPPPRRPNILLITIDTVRADHVGCYGATAVHTPTLDALAHDGLVFERAISQVPLTWPSHAVILTGTYPFQNGVQDFTGQPLAPQFRSVAQAFKQHGYATGAVVSAFVLDRSWGLARGFDFYDDAFSAETFQTKDIGLVDRRAADSISHAIDWLRKDWLSKDQQHQQRPFFFWLHLYDPHSPYDPPEPFHTEYKDHLYDGEIAYADHELARLIDWLKRNRLYDSTLIIMLSDHGESLGEHGEDEHGFFVYNATVHIPLIVKPPAGSGFRPGSVARPVETVAVAPTLVRLAGIQDPIQKQFQSPSLLAGISPLENKDDAGTNPVPAAERRNTKALHVSAGSEQQNDPSGGAPGLADFARPGNRQYETTGTDVPLADAAYSETFYPFSSFGWSPLHALETSRYHYIEAPEPELYDLDADPGETTNLAANQPAIVAVLREKLQARLRNNPLLQTTNSPSRLTAEAQEKLRALGYFGFRAPVSPETATSLPDPKTKISVFNTILKAEDAFHQHDDDRAEAFLLQVQEQDPKIYVVPFLLGESALRHQNWTRAADQLQRCLELNPNFDNAMTGLARALDKLGRSDEARNWLQRAAQINPENYRAWYEIGLLQARSDPAAALASYEKAISIQPNFSPGQRELGLALLQQKSYASAAIHLEKAIALGLDDAHIRNFLGICYSQTNRRQKSIDSYRVALKSDPNLAEAHLNLAYELQRVGQIPQARAEYQTACQLEPKFCSVSPK